MNRKNISAFAAMLLCYAACGQSIPQDTAVHTGVLPNGFTYFIRHNEIPKNRVQLYLVNKVGSVLENDDQQGLAHFLEHMNFNGTKHFPKNELVDYLQKSGVRFGADLNAYTSFDETVYQLPLPTDNASILQNGFQIMRDWAQEATLDPIEINKERGVVLEEKRLGKGAQERMQRQYWPILFNHSRYAERIPIGKENILTGFTPSTIRNFYSDWYRPDLQALIVVGDIDVAQTETTIKKMFSDLKVPENEKPRISYNITLNGGNQFMTVTDKEMPITELQVMIKHKADKLITGSDYLRSIKKQLFNQMLAGRFSELRQQADPSFLNADAGINVLVGNVDMFAFSVGTKKNQLKQGFSTAWEAIEKVKRFGFTETELLRAKQMYINRLEAAFKEKDKTNSSSFVGEYQRLFLENEASPGIVWEYQFAKNNLGSITLAEIAAVTAEYITNNNRDVLILAPENLKDILPDSSTVADWFEAAAHKKLTPFVDQVSGQLLMPIKPVAGKIIAEKKIPEIGATQLELSNGVKVLLKPTTYKNDEIRFTAFSAGGTSLYSDKDFVAASNAAIIAGFGLANFTPLQLNKMLTGKMASASPYIGERTQGINGATTPKDLETALQLVYLRFTQPRKDTVLFNNLIANTTESLKTRYTDPANVFNDTIAIVMGNHNYRRTPLTVEKLKQIGLEKEYQIYKKRFADAAGFTFVFVGNFNIDSIKPLLAQYLGGLPSLHRNEVASNLNIKTPDGLLVKKVYKGKEDKATVRLVFHGTYNFSQVNNISLNALAEVLEIKLIQRLREEESEVYSPSVQASYAKYPENKYAINISFGCAPNHVNHLVETVNKEIEALKINGASGVDVEKFKAEYRRNHELQLLSNNYWLAYLNNQLENHESLLQVLDYEKVLDQVSPADLQKAALRYLNNNQLIEFGLFPQID